MVCSIPPLGQMVGRKSSARLWMRMPTDVDGSVSARRHLVEYLGISLVAPTAIGLDFIQGAITLPQKVPATPAKSP